MTPIRCAEHVVDVLKEAFDGYVSTDEKTSANGLTICAGFLPRKSNSKEKAALCPRIVVRPVQVTDNDESDSLIELQVLAVTYCEDMNDGHFELYNLMEGIRQALLTHKIVGEVDMLQLPMTTTIPEEQPFPMWWGWMKVTYSIPQSVNHEFLHT